VGYLGVAGAVLQAVQAQEQEKEQAVGRLN
jgi:hypothetical protein